MSTRSPKMRSASAGGRRARIALTPSKPIGGGAAPRAEPPRQRLHTHAGPEGRAHVARRASDDRSPDAARAEVAPWAVGVEDAVHPPGPQAKVGPGLRLQGPPSPAPDPEQARQRRSEGLVGHRYPYNPLRRKRDNERCRPWRPLARRRPQRRQAADLAPRHEATIYQTSRA